MIIFSQVSDDLTLALVKQHLYVDIVEDDTLITSYMNASLRLCQNYLSDSVLETVYKSESHEDIVQGNYLILNLPYKPKSVILTLSTTAPDNILTDSYQYEASTTLTNTIIVHEDYYEYVGNELRINITNIINYDSTITYSTNVTTGNNPVLNTVNQARLLTVGEWYANRENSTSMSVNELPFNTKILLDIEQNSFL